MDHKAITFNVAADLFLLLLIGIGPKIALGTIPGDHRRHGRRRRSDVFVWQMLRTPAIGVDCPPGPWPGAGPLVGPQFRPLFTPAVGLLPTIAVFMVLGSCWIL